MSLWLRLDYFYVVTYSSRQEQIGVTIGISVTKGISVTEIVFSNWIFQSLALDACNEQSRLLEVAIVGLDGTYGACGQ